VQAHKRIIFNGNGYDDAWVKEAEKRKLLNLKSTPDCIPYLVAQKNIDLLTSHKVLSEIEIRSRLEIMLENYKKIVCIEAMTMIDMARKDILPASAGFQKKLADTIAVKRTYASAADCTYETDTLVTAAALTHAAYESVKALEDALAAAKAVEDAHKAAEICKERVLEQMSELRASVDALEILTATSDWPYPSYGDLLFNVR